MSGRFGTFAVIAGLMLGGCGGSVARDPAASRPVAPTTGPTVSVTLTASPSPSQVAPAVPADVPTSGANLKVEGERPPVMPVAATQHTRAGAVAFAEFFIRTIDWGYATTSSAYMRHYMTSACIACVSIADAIDGAAAKRRHFIGDRLSIKPGSEAKSDGSGAGLPVDVEFEVTSGEVVDQQGNFVDGAPALRQAVVLDLEWGSSQWSVVGWTAVT